MVMDGPDNTPGRVARCKNGKDNWYELEHPIGSDVQYYRGFGQSVPEPISAFLNMSDINFQFQHDPLFLLSNSPAELSKTLNAIAGLDVIDHTQSKINARYLADKRLVTTKEQSVTEWEKELAKYTSTDDLEVELILLDGLVQEVVDKRRRLGEVRGLGQRLLVGEKQLAKYDGLDQLASVYSPLPVILADIDNKRRKEADIRSLRHNLGFWGVEVSKYQLLGDLDSAVQSAFAKHTITVTKTTAYRRHIDHARGLANQLTALDGVLLRSPAFDPSDITQTQRELQEQCRLVQEKRQTAGQIRLLSDKWKLLDHNQWMTTKQLVLDTKEYEESMPDQCPLCGSITHREGG